MEIMEFFQLHMQLLE
ncbi:hypothetical protein LINPERHAP2_LOCUS143 [Linum perenne]